MRMLYKIATLAALVTLGNSLHVSAQEEKIHAVIITARICYFKATERGGQKVMVHYCTSFFLGGPTLIEEYGSVKRPIVQEKQVTSGNCKDIIKERWTSLSRKLYEKIRDQRLPKGAMGTFRITCEIASQRRI